MKHQKSHEFEQLWSSLFMTPVHLDSALSKLSKNVKSALAAIVPTILLRPVSEAEALGVGVPPGEPWNLESHALAQWRPAVLVAERLEGMLRGEAGGHSTLSAQRSLPVSEDFPPYMIEEWRKSWGTEVADQLIAVLGKEAPLSLRATQKVGAKALLAGLTEGSRLPVRAELSSISPLGVRLAGYAAILGTELYEKGAFEIQDEGSQLMSLFALWPERFGVILQNAPGAVRDEPVIKEVPQDPPAWTVIDACAGAGGKSLAIADALGGKGRVFAYDTSSTKLQALRRRATRAGLNNIQAVTVEEGAETKVIGRFKKTAQAVLVDAPCSGWGVLRRNPDIKWRQSRDVLTRMPQVQLRLLTQYAELVVPGGRLTYGVCTFRAAETRDVVRSFLETSPEFEAREGGYFGPGPCDGFFMQSFIRRNRT